jgi:predicted XRE-type DNA-binding protein
MRVIESERTVHIEDGGQYSDSYRQTLTTVLLQLLSLKRYTKVQLAELMKYDPKVVDNLVEEGFRGFSSPQIVRVLHILGYEVQVKITAIEKESKNESKS